MIFHKSFFVFVLFLLTASIPASKTYAKKTPELDSLKRSGGLVLVKAVLTEKNTDTNSKEKIVASPKTITTHGTEAKVIMGDIHSWKDGSNAILSGIELKVSPQIVKGGIRLAGTLLIIFPMNGDNKGENSTGHWTYTHSLNANFNILFKYPQSSITLKPVTFDGKIYKLSLTANQVDVNGKLIAPGK